MKISETLSVAFVSVALTGLIIASFSYFEAPRLLSPSQPAFERVMKSHTLRCAYSSLRPYFVALDTDRNMRRGLAHDIVEQMGRILGLKIEWVEEVGPREVPDHLASGAEDAMCFPLWPDGKNAAVLDFTEALDYMPIYAFARSDDQRFDGNLGKLNVHDAVIPIIPEGEVKNIADEDFPLASQLNIEVEPDPLHMMLAVTTKKADVGFGDPFTVGEFMRSNPGTLKYVANIQPVRVFGESFAVAKGETKLRDTLNVAIEEMQENGMIQVILDQYLGDHKGEYFYWSRPWQP